VVSLRLDENAGSQESARNRSMANETTEWVVIYDELRPKCAAGVVARAQIRAYGSASTFAIRTPA